VVTGTVPVATKNSADGDDDASPDVLTYPHWGNGGDQGKEKAGSSRVAPGALELQSIRHGTGVKDTWTTPLFDSTGHRAGFNDTWTMGMVIVDLDGDGDSDLVSGEIDGRIVAWQNDGTPFAGEWTGHQVGVVEESWWTLLALAAGDLDNDGDIDLVSGYYYGHGPRIWENDGNPFAGEWSWQQVGDHNVGALALADVDGDERLDIVAGGGVPWRETPSEDNRVTVWHAPASPFSDTWRVEDVGLAYYSVLGLDVDDLDNDGDNDIVIGTYRAPAVGDVDNPVPRDQWTDVYQIRSFRNDGGDNWVEFNVGRDPKPETLDFVYAGFWGATVTDVALADLDNDGDLDIAATERNTGDFLVMAWQNDGTPFSGELWAPTAVAIGDLHNWLGTHVYWVEAGDFDRDGDLDLVTGNEPREPYQVMVWENSGAAFGTVITDTSWVRHNVGVLGETTKTGGVADFDGDGYLDLVAGAYVSTANEIRVWKNYGEPVSRIQCQAGYIATLYARGLSSPNGLAFDPSGVLHVAEGTAGRVSRIEPGGSIITVAGGLASPAGIAFDASGNLYVVENVQDGRLVRVAPGGSTMDLATGRDAPKGVVWTADGSVYITESNVEYTPSPYDFRTRVTAVSPLGEVMTILTDTLYWSYAGIAIGADGLLYVTNEASGIGTNDSIFTVSPLTGERTLFASGLVMPKGLRFAANGDFPLYVVEKDTGGGVGRLSRVEADGSYAHLCTGFYSIEDVVMDEGGRLFVSEGGSGWIIAIAKWAYQTYLPIVLRAP
jgi:sugar lactone lactonase YvrE